MDDRKDKAIFGQDAEPLPPRKKPAQESGADEIDCSEDHDFDIVFEFEPLPHGPN